jgi:hypothetical protein
VNILSKAKAAQTKIGKCGYTEIKSLHLTKKEISKYLQTIHLMRVDIQIYKELKSIARKQP